MSNEISKLTPTEVWGNFYQLTRIPRPSHHEDQIRQYVADFGRKLGLETIQDAVGNVIIRKPATPGMEKRKGVILQGHLDMVPQKNSDKDHDFAKDPIETIIDGEWVRANGTTLGADNGIGVAAAMAVRTWPGYSERRYPDQHGFGRRRRIVCGLCRWRRCQCYVYLF